MYHNFTDKELREKMMREWQKGVAVGFGVCFFGLIGAAWLGG